MFACTDWSVPATVFAIGLAFLGGFLGPALAGRIKHGKVPR